jgi:hypothetical protein
LGFGVLEFLSILHTENGGVIATIMLGITSRNEWQGVLLFNIKCRNCICLVLKLHSFTLISFDSPTHNEQRRHSGLPHISYALLIGQ